MSTTICCNCGSEKRHYHYPERRQKDIYVCLSCAKARAVKWQEDNPERDREIRQKEYRNNKPRYRAKSAARRARKLNQTPLDADHGKIQEFYREAERLTAETGEAHHVDHIHPLSKGGLHHQDNLQVLTATENLQKSDKLQWRE